MDPQERAFHMREQLKQIYRARLPDMGWCDDISQRKQQVEEAFRLVRGDWEAEANQYKTVLAAALEASSTDNEHQTINLTIPNDRSFWSSRGHPSQVAHEALLYEVIGPACKVVSVKVAPYRALYQDGYPVYPPMRLQVWAGATPYSLQPASPWQDVQASDALQTFALWPHAPLARYLQVRMYGKLQKQREDMQFYVAIRHVDVSGTALSTPDLLSYRCLMRSNAITLGGTTPNLPATCTAALQAAADYGVGPCLAAAAATLQPGAWQSQPQGLTLTQQAGGSSSSSSSSNSSRVPAASCRLVSCPGVLQELPDAAAGGTATGGSIATAVQQQEQGYNAGGWAVQRVTAGLRSILGRRGAAAAAMTCPSDDGPSKRHQQHVQREGQQPGTLPVQQQQHVQQQLQQQQQRVPLWLVEEAAAAAAMASQHQDSQQQQQQRHVNGPQADSVAADAAVADPGPQATQPDRGMTSDDVMDVTDDDDMGVSDDGVPSTDSIDDANMQQQQHGGVPADANWEAAQRLNEQIARRLQDVAPWQQEHVLAELLADEPIGGRSAFRQRLASLRQQHIEQQQQPDADGPHPAAAAFSPPVVAIMTGSNESSSGGSSGSDAGGWCEVSRGGDSELLVRSRVVLGSSAIKAAWYLMDSMLEAMANADVHDQQRLRQRYAASFNAAAAAAAADTSTASPRAGPAAAGSPDGSPASVDAAAASDRPILEGTSAGRQQQQQADGVSDPAVPELPALVSPQPTTPAAATPAVTAKHLFLWKPAKSAAAGSDVTGCGSSSAEQHAWLQPASSFCEGLEADLWAC